MALVQDLPELWKTKHGNYPFEGSDDGKSRASSIQGSPVDRRRDALPRTPIRLLAEADKRESDRAMVARVSNRSGVASWSSPGSKSSPSDQLIAAILDGDVQGIRSVVRSKGDDLNSDFWRDLSRSVLPLHRAVSGLHFHGNEKLLVGTIEALCQLGADVNSTDHAGNSVLHKALQVCTSKSVATVVRTLLNRGANPQIKNKDGDTPLHVECKRYVMNHRQLYAS